MARVLIILPSSGYRTADFLDAADNLNARVVVATDGTQTLAGQMGDGLVEIDLRRPEWSADRIVEHAQRQPIDAIMPVDDHGVVVAALAAARLGLAHNPPDAVAATRDKAESRRRLRAAGLSQPAFRTVGPEEDPGAAASAVGFPCVLKPTSLAASRGVIRADDVTGAHDAADRIRRMLLAEACDPTLIVEAFVPGREFALEGLVTDGELTVLALFDKPDPLDGPFFEETLLVAPARVSPAQRASLIDAAGAAARALGLRHGPLHCEMRMNASEVVVIEAAARPIGGLCGRSLRFGLLGTSLETLLLRHALGFAAAETSLRGAASGVMMLPIPRAGVLRSVTGRADALAVPGVVDLEITIPVGHEVRPLPEGDRYLGFLFARGSSADDVESALRTGYERLDIVIG